MTGHKADINIAKIDKYKETEQHFYDGAQNRHEITDIDKYKKTEQLFCDRTQNRIQLHFGEPRNKHIQIHQRINKLQISPRKNLTKISINN